MLDLYLNGAFVGQRVTGQQRYATEISAELVRRHSGRILDPPPRLRKRAVLSHAWARGVLPALSASGALVSMTARSPVLARCHILVVHDLFVLQHPEWYSKKYVRTHAPILLAQMRAASALVAVSAPMADQLRERYPRKRIGVAPNAPSRIFQRPLESGLPAEVVNLLQTPGAEGFFFAVGSRDPRKNFARLIDAYEGLPAGMRLAYPLVIAGGSSPVFAASETRAAKDVRWLGYVTDADLAALYSAATAVVVPSLDEGFGLPVVEALAAGGRLAVSDIPTFRWVAGDDVEYFRPDDVPDITRALRLMVSSPSASILPSGPYERFTWAESADAIARLLQDVS